LRASSKSDSAITFNKFRNFMKPTPQISPDQRNSRCDNRTPDDSRNFPSTDYNFQSTTEACGSVSTISQEKLRTFWKLSSEFFSAETGAITQQSSCSSPLSVEFQPGRLSRPSLPWRACSGITDGDQRRQLARPRSLYGLRRAHSGVLLSGRRYRRRCRDCRS